MPHKNLNIDDDENAYMYKTLNNNDTRSRKSHNSLEVSSSVFNKTKFEKLMIHKMAYEWKNIYRALSSVDQAGLGVINITEFLQICDRNRVSIIPLESKQLMKQFGVANDSQDMEALGLNENEAQDLINFKRLSIHLGLHKESYNYLNKV